MSLYLPAHFASDDLRHLDALLAADPFVTLITVDSDGSPCVGHLPVLHRHTPEGVLLEGHWARANPQWLHARPATMAVHGPHAYVSPGVYPDKEAAARVPTWNYAVAHLRGTLEVYDDEAALADLVDRLSRHFEATVGRDWRFEPAREDHRRQLCGIVGFRFRAERIAIKLKMSQNHPAANRAAVAADLASREEAGAREVADWMRRIGD